jgi:methyl-accepting chemotaxis protein PixJ
MTNLSQKNQVTNDSDMTPEDLAPVLHKPDQPEQILEPQFHLDQPLSSSNGNGDKAGLNSNIEPHQALALVTAIKADLEESQELRQPEIHEKILQLEKWAQGLQTVSKPHLAVATDHRLKRDREWLLTLSNQMRRATDLDLDILLKITVSEVREYLQVDRALIYSFQSQNQGMVIAESILGGYTPSLGETLSAIAFGAQDQLDYQQQQIVALEHIYQKAPSPYQLQLMQRFQVKASLSLPIIVDGLVWGLLVVQQCSGISRRWQEVEVNLLNQVITELRLNLQPTEIRTQQKKQVEQTKVVGKVAAKILKNILYSVDVESVFNSATREIRQHLQCDRVAVYRFNPNWGGEFVAESVGSDWVALVGPDIKKVWTDTYLQETRGGRYRNEESHVVNNIYSAGLNDCHISLLEQFEAKAYIIAPIFEGENLWGLLAAFQNSGPRQWDAAEVSMLALVGRQFGVAIQQAQYLGNLQQQAEKITKTVEQERANIRTIEKIRQSSDIDTIFKTTTLEVRKLLKVERVTIYKFRPDYFGDFLVESESGGWPKLVGSGWEDPYLQEHQGGRFRKNEPLVTDDVYDGSLSECHVEALEYFGVKSCMVVAIFQGNKLWGLLSAFQHSGPRHWEEGELKILTQIASHLGVALQQAEYLEQLRNKSSQITKAAEQERAAGKVIEKIRQTAEIDSIFKTTTHEVRKLLNVDRVTIYKFRPDYFGDFLVESESGDWPKLVGSGWEDPYLQEHQGGRFRSNQPLVVDDVYNAGLTECHVEALEYFGVKGCLVVAIFKGKKLWGLLSAFQHSEPRHWEEGEVNILTQIGSHLGVALQQAEYVDQLREQSNQLAKAAEREKAVAKITTKILQSLNQATIFQITTQEVRLLLKCDRTAIYRFEPDWSGIFIAESVAKGWVPLVSGDIQTVWADTYLQETQGGRYRHKESFAVEDIYTIGHSPCHVEILEQFEIRAYLLVPIFIREKLWGILCAYQNTGPRQWEEAEVVALNQIGLQVGAALQLVDYVGQVGQKSEQLATLVERETNFINLIYKTGNRITGLLQQKTLNSDSLFRATTQELRQLLKADRVAVYRFNPDWSGEFVIEDVGSAYIRLVGMDAAQVADPILQETKGGQYSKDEASVVNDITATDNLTFSKVLLEEWGAQAYAIAPIFKGDQLWGLLTTYQNTEPRSWEEGEVNFLVQMARQLGMVLQQAEYLEQIQYQSQQITEAAQREKADKEALQQKVIQLLSAVRPALKGDLTVRAPVTEDEVGTIADAYNNMLQSLRGIVKQVQVASRQVAQTSQDRESSMAALSEQAQLQFQSLDQALEQIQSMINITEVVGTNAQQVEMAVQQANQTVRDGNAAMNRTVDGILTIRETVAETSKRIKRLSESSQKVSRVVSLISSFTTQTQLLALNAAIEATRAGEYGRGFVVVADEVRSLARQSADATTEIAQLVQEIQEGTSEVSTAMETGIEQVAAGTNFVTDARQHLNAIVEATAQISQLVEGISQATHIQAQQFQSVTQTMSHVAAISNKTSEDSIEISTSFKDLLAMAQNLQSSADQFKVD